VVGQVFGVLTQRVRNPVESAGYGRNMAWVARWVFLPSSAVVIVTGMALTEDGDWGWGEPFVLFGLLAGIAIAAIGIGYVTPRMGRAGARMSAEGPSPEILAEMNRLVWIARGLLLVAFVIIFMMVVKLGT
jgi:F0F1-type ATP synthase membrane subunit c/vacuolar-type H+-ATPase subunit K